MGDDGAQGDPTGESNRNSSLLIVSLLLLFFVVVVVQVEGTKFW